MSNQYVLGEELLSRTCQNGAGIYNLFSLEISEDRVTDVILPRCHAFMRRVLHNLHHHYFLPGGQEYSLGPEHSVLGQYGCMRLYSHNPHLHLQAETESSQVQMLEKWICLFSGASQLSRGLNRLKPLKIFPRKFPCGVC